MNLGPLGGRQVVTPIEEAIYDFATKVHSTSMGASRVDAITLDAATWDRLAAALESRMSYRSAARVTDDPLGGPMREHLILATATGFVYVARGGAWTTHDAQGG